MKPKYSPILMQYLSIKEENQDSIVMFRLGDFYEMFFDDAILVSKELEIALTGKNARVAKEFQCAVYLFIQQQLIFKDW